MRNLLLSAVPSSGSDWLKSVILRANPKRIADDAAKEFFNPLCNIGRYELLARVFGCETVDTCERLAEDVEWDRFQSVVDAAWPDELNFTKEVWCAHRIPQFVGMGWDVTVLVRHPRHTFPATRLRVYSWYLSYAQSIERKHGITLKGKAGDRALQAQIAMCGVAMAWARRCKAPLVHWDELMTMGADGLRQLLARCTWANDDAVDLILAERSGAADVQRREEAFDRSGATMPGGSRADRHLRG